MKNKRPSLYAVVMPPECRVGRHEINGYAEVPGKGMVEIIATVVDGEIVDHRTASGGQIGDEGGRS